MMQNSTSSIGETCVIYSLVNGAGSPSSVVTRACVHNQS